MQGGFHAPVVGLHRFLCAFLGHMSEILGGPIWFRSGLACPYWMTGYMLPAVKASGLILVLLALTACGAVRAVRETERILNEYECLAQELNGDLPCKPD